MTRKILILYTSVTIGHKSIAENIGWHLKKAGFDVKLYDAHQVEEGKLAKRGTKVNEFLMLKLPLLWKWLYDSKLFADLTLPLRIKVARKHHQKTLELINKLSPDVVITTQVTASGVMAYLKQHNLYKGKFGIAFSDFHFHPYWVYGQADFFLANIEEQKQEMVKLRISAHKIFVCGLTLKPKVEVDAQAVKNKFNIQSSQKVVLIASGSLGSGIDENLIQRLSQKPNIRVIAVCGRNKAAFEKLHQKFTHTSATILGFHSPMDELYAIADIFLTKPGALSVSEALRFYLPILITHELPGGERHNSDYLLSRRLIMNQTADVFESAMAELETGWFKKQLINNTYLQELFNREQEVVKAVSLKA